MYLFMLTIDDGTKRNIFAVADKKKVGYSEVQKWISDYSCVILDYKCIGHHKGEPIESKVDKVDSLPNVMLFGNLYTPVRVKDCTECVYFNGEGGCGVKAYRNKGRDHCLKQYGYKRM